MLKYNSEISGSDVKVIIFDAFYDENLFLESKNVFSKHEISGVIKSSVDSLLDEIKNSKHKITHSIIRLKSHYDEEFVRVLKETSAKGFTSCSVAFSYDNYDHAIKYEVKIKKAKENLGKLNSFNLIRPNTYSFDKFISSNQKLVDNIICDTIRIKYSCNRLSDESIVQHIPEYVKRFFNEASDNYMKHSMFHRSDTDGYFAIRYDEDIYITATKTPKINLDLNRIVKIHAYDRKTNTITFSGEYIPSSDAVEACVIFYSNNNVDELIHTHDSVNFTRNNRALETYPVIDEMPYGEPELGDEITQAWKKHNSNIVLMKEHGEVFIGTKFIGANTAISNSLEQVEVCI